MLRLKIEKNKIFVYYIMVRKRLRFHPRWSTASRNLMAAVRGRRGRPRRRVRRRRRRTVHNQRYNSVNNALVSRTLQGKRRANTLKNRVAALEVGSKKHHNFLGFRSQQILSYGVATMSSGQFGIAPSQLGFLRIPPKNTAGEIQNGSSVIEDQVRSSDEVFVKSALIRFQLETYRPSPLLTDASAIALVPMLKQSDMHTRVVFTILKDKFPALPTGQSTSEPNPHSSTPGERPLEQIYERAGYFDAADNNTMITTDYSPGGGANTNYGADNSQHSYDGPNRYKIVHQETITLNSLTPRKLVKHRLVINKRLKYMAAAQQEGDPIQPSDPLNCNYLLFLTTTASINPLDNHNIPNPALAMLEPPTVSLLNIRTYFTDS